jgi:hypothetical protein
MSNRDRLAEKLLEQLRFIERSCSAFDQGAEDEAIRIATSLRVIFHSTRVSVSLVEHLGLNGKDMLSSSRGFGDWMDYLSHELDMNTPQPVRMLPLLGSKFRKCSIEDWWNDETVFIHNGRNYSRRMIILSAANKDGGAHVDEELEEYYEVLCAGEYALGIVGNLEYNGEPAFPQGVAHYPKNAHLALIRQFAHETRLSINHFNWLKDVT